MAQTKKPYLLGQKLYNKKIHKESFLASKSEYFRNQFTLKKTNYRQSFEIVTGQILAIRQNKIRVSLPKDRIGECSLFNVSDYTVKNLHEKFSVGQFVDIAITGINPNGVCILNYKMVHPKEIKYKLKAIPTASHYRVLSKQLNQWILQADVDEPNLKKK